MEKILFFASEQWLLITALAAAVWALAWLDNRRAGNSLTPHALTTLVNGDDAIVVDLRDKTQFDGGHIVGSVNLPFTQLQSQLASGAATELDSYQQQNLVLVCQMGQQSSHLAKKLKPDNYAGVYRLAGGIGEWQNAQMPLVKS
jgi:rhodanese-related sulfurtransferase